MSPEVPSGTPTFLPLQLLDRGDAGLGDDPVGVAERVDRDDLRLAGGGQPEGAGADVAEVEVAGAERLDLHRAVGEDLRLAATAVLLPQALLVGDGEQAGAVVVADVAEVDRGSAGRTRRRPVPSSAGRQRPA
jgi:hypothetical protein